MDINLVKNIVNGGKFGQNRSFLVNMVKMGGHFGIFGGHRWRHMSKVWEKGPIIFSVKFSENISVKFMNINLGKRCN